MSGHFTTFKKQCKKGNEDIIVNLSVTKGSFYFKNFYNMKSNPWFFDLESSRKTIVSINRLRSNQSSLNSSLFRKNITSSKDCQCGYLEDSTERVFWECELYEEARKNLKIKYFFLL